MARAVKNQFIISLVAVSCLWFVSVAYSTPAQQDPVLSSYRLQTNNPNLLDQISRQYEIMRIRAGEYEVIVPQEQSQKFKQMAPQARLRFADIRDEFKERRNKKGQIEGYHTFQDVIGKLRYYATHFDDLASLEIYGYSQDQRPLMALKLSATAKSHKSLKPKLMMTAATHGDELITTEVVLGFIKNLIKDYHQKNNRVRTILKSLDLFFIPVVNPDGFVQQSRYAHGSDPNRAYPWPEVPERNPVTCIRKIIKFFHKYSFAGTIDYHAYGRLIMFPWAYTYEPIPSEDYITFNDLTAYMAEFNQYTYGQISEVIYIARGSSADYYYWKNRSVALGIEVGESKIPDPSQIPEIIEENYEPFLRYAEHFINF